MRYSVFARTVTSPSDRNSMIKRFSLQWIQNFTMNVSYNNWYFHSAERTVLFTPISSASSLCVGTTHAVISSLCLRLENIILPIIRNPCRRDSHRYVYTQTYTYFDTKSKWKIVPPIFPITHTRKLPKNVTGSDRICERLRFALFTVLCISRSQHYKQWTAV